MSVQTSKFRFYSVGVAAENKKANSKELEVYPIEFMPYAHGEVNSDQESIETKGVDGDGKPYAVSFSTSNSIKAKWFPWNTHQITAPDIRRGEEVLIFQYADADEYFWVATRGNGLRRLETVVYAFSNTKNEKHLELTPDNSWYVEVSTHTKKITLKTNKSDGEPFAYTLQFNAKDGYVTLADDDGNYFELDSAERKLTLKNKDQSILQLNKRDILMSSVDSITQKTKTYKLECDTMEMDASTSGLIKTPDITIQSTNLHGNITASDFTGTVTIHGLTTLAGGISAIPGSGGATASIQIPIDVQASARFTADIEAGGKNIGPMHSHMEQGDGQPVGPVI